MENCGGGWIDSADFFRVIVSALSKLELMVKNELNVPPLKSKRFHG